MDLNRYLVCLLLACCIYSVTGRVGSFLGGLDVLKSLFLIFFNLGCFVRQCKRAICPVGTDVVWLRRLLQFFKCFDTGLGNHLLWLMLVW